MKVLRLSAEAAHIQMNEGAEESPFIILDMLQVTKLGHRWKIRSNMVEGRTELRLEHACMLEMWHAHRRI